MLGALNTRDPRTVCRALLATQHLLRSDPRVGRRFVPHYRHLLPPFARLSGLPGGNSGKRGDTIEYGQRKRCNVDDLAEETLAIMEKAGGAGALAAIKFVVPGFTRVRM